MSQSRMRNQLTLVILTISMVSAFACIVPIKPDSGAPETGFRELGNGKLEFDGIILNKNDRSITFPAVVNMNTGLVEYVVVTTKGKVHESLFRTEVNPTRLHASLLLLGAEAATGASAEKFHDPKSKIPGDPVQIEFSWKDGEKVVKRTASELMGSREKPALLITNWIYNGSQMLEGMFLADREGSIVSLIADPAALINNPREDRQNDELWQANPDRMPPLNHPVEVVIKLQKKTEKSVGKSEESNEKEK